MDILDMCMISGLALLSEEAKDLARKKLGPKSVKPKKFNKEDFIQRQKMSKFLENVKSSNREKLKNLNP